MEIMLVVNTECLAGVNQPALDEVKLPCSFHQVEFGGAHESSQVGTVAKSAFF